MKEDPPGGHRMGASTDEQGSSGWVTTKVAAEVLGVAPQTVRAHIRRGNLQAKSEGEGKQKAYLVSLESIHALKDQQSHSGDIPGESPKEAADMVVSERDFTGFVRDLTAELVQKASEAAELRTRLELTERSESNLREQIRRERERADRLEAERDRLFPDLLHEKDRADAERERAEHFEPELRAALEARRGWLRRFFGF